MVAISDPKRKSGISILGDVPWGTHFCQFYHTKQDLIDILVPYFKTGLENNEFCMWVTSEPLTVQEARAALQKAVQDLDQYSKKGQIEILDFSQWYTRTGQFDADKVLQGWVDKEQQARKNGFEGLRLTGNTFWIEHKDWKSFSDYEATINNVVHNYKMLAICSYSLDKCDAREILDVFSTHQFALIVRNGKWATIESTERRRGEDALRESEERYRSLFKNMLNGYAFCKILVDEENKPVDFIYIDVNDAFETLTGLRKEDVIGKRVSEAIPSIKESNPEIIPVYGKVASTGVPTAFEVFVKPLDMWLTISVYSPHKDYFVAVFDNITERKRAEESLRRSQQLLSNMFLSLPEAVFLVDAETARIKSCNPAASEIFGYSPEEMLGQTTELLHVDAAAREEFGRHVRAAAAERGWLQHFEFRMKRKNGEVFPSEHSVIPLDDEHSKHVAWVSVVRDITERKRAQEELRRSEERFQLVARATNDVVWDWDLVTNAVGWNEGVTTLLGYPPSEVGSDVTWWYEHIEPQQRDRVVSGIHAIIDSGGQSWSDEYRYLRADGSYAEIFDRGYVMRDETGKPARMIGAMMDITARKQAQKAVQESEQRLRTIVEVSLDAIVAVNAEGRIVLFNDAAQDLFQYSKEDALKQPAKILLREEMGQIHQERLERFLNAGVGRCGHIGKRMEKVFRRKDGSLFEGEVSMSGGRLDGLRLVVLAVHDITARKQAEQALQESEEKYRRLFSHASDALLILDLETHRFLDANEAASQLYGHTHDEFLRLRAEDISGEPEQTAAALRELEEERSIRVPVRWHRKKDGTIFPVELSARPFLWKGQQVSCVFIRDITERKQAEEQIQSLSRFPAENPNPILRLQRDGTVIYANPSARPLLQLWGCEVGQRVPADWARPVADSLSSGAGKKVEVACNQRVYSFILAPIQTAGYVNAYGRDITERKRAEEDLLVSHRQLRALAAHIQAVREDERMKLARDIHDLFGQALTGIKMDLHAWEKKIATLRKGPTSAFFRDRVSSMQNLIGSAVEEVRRLATELRPAVLDDFGLEAAIEWQAKEFERHTGIKCRVASSLGEIALGQAESTAAFRTCQEALTNVARHAHATRVQVRLRKVANCLVLEVEDNGRGINEADVGGSRSLGILGMRERALVFGGEVSFLGAAGKGTTVKARIPLGVPGQGGAST